MIDAALTVDSACDRALDDPAVAKVPLIGFRRSTRVHDNPRESHGVPYTEGVCGEETRWVRAETVGQPTFGNAAHAMGEKHGRFIQYIVLARKE